MAFRWRADDDPTLNAGLVVFENFRGSGPVLLEILCFFVIFQVGGCPPSGSTHGTGRCLHLLRYTETRIGFCTTLCVLSIDRQVERERDACSC